MVPFPAQLTGVYQNLRLQELEDAKVCNLAYRSIPDIKTVRLRLQVYICNVLSLSLSLPPTPDIVRASLKKRACCAEREEADGTRSGFRSIDGFRVQIKHSQRAT